MYDKIHDQIKEVTAYLHLGEVTIDNIVFKLHYVASVSIFVVYSLIVTIGTYAGDPIDCKTALGTEHVDREDNVFEKFLDEDSKEGSYEDCVTHHTSYLWVPLVVLLQAGLSYLPHHLWYHWEGGRMKAMLAKLLERPKFFNNDTEDKQKRQTMIDKDTVVELRSSGNKLTEELAKDYIDTIGDNSFYALKYTVAEVLCLVTSILQILLTNKFLNESFISYGGSAIFDLSGDPFSRADPMERTLPVVAMCSFNPFGLGGRRETINAICVLPNNIVHQKFYLFLWFWLFFLVSVTSIHLIYRLALYLLPSFRSYVTNTLWAVVNDTEHTQEERLKCFVNKNTCYSDWILLSFFHSNLTSVNFQNFIDDLAYFWRKAK